MKLYIYADLLSQTINVSTCNFWYSKQSQETGLYKDGTTALQLLETHEFSLDHIKFDFISGKIQALESQLGDLHVKSENIKAQIQELKYIGHESLEEKERVETAMDFDQFDDDVPF